MKLQFTILVTRLFQIPQTPKNKKKNKMCMFVCFKRAEMIVLHSLIHSVIACQFVSWWAMSPFLYLPVFCILCCNTFCVSGGDGNIELQSIKPQNNFTANSKTSKFWKKKEKTSHGIYSYKTETNDVFCVGRSYIVAHCTLISIGIKVRVYSRIAT